MFNRIAVAFDESPEAERAFRVALELAKLLSSELSIITVVEDFPAYLNYVSAVAPGVPALLNDQRRAFYSELQNKAKRTAVMAGVELHCKLTEGSETEALLDMVAGVMPDLLVVGLRDESADLSRFWGGTAHKIAQHACCDVLSNPDPSYCWLPTKAVLRLDSGG